jgi:hypothetical protein
MVCLARYCIAILVDSEYGFKNNTLAQLAQADLLAI